MTEEHAEQVVDFLLGFLRPPDREQTPKAWRETLLPLDANIASQAIVAGVQVWEHFPSWPAFMVEYRAIQRRLEESERPVLEPAKPQRKPLWVTRWKRARSLSFRTRAEALEAGVPEPVQDEHGLWRDLRPFPEQEPFLTPAERPAAPFSDRAFWVQADEYLPVA